jgi:hypothetical protein
MHDYSQTLAEILGRLHQIEGHLSRPVAEYDDAEQAAVPIRAGRVLSVD